MTRRQRVTFELVELVTTWLQAGDGGLDLLDLRDVNDWLLSVVTDSEHGYRNGSSGLRGTAGGPKNDVWKRCRLGIASKTESFSCIRSYMPHGPCVPSMVV